jgi:hypothetical protein
MFKQTMLFGILFLPVVAKRKAFQTPKLRLSRLLRGLSARPAALQTPFK